MPMLLGWTPGPLEMIVLALVVLLLFGNRLPGLMRSLGRGVVEFKKGVSGQEEEQQEDDDVTPASKPKQESKP